MGKKRRKIKKEEEGKEKRRGGKRRGGRKGVGDRGRRTWTGRKKGWVIGGGGRGQGGRIGEEKKEEVLKLKQPTL